MNRVSQVGALMANFGSLLTSMAQVVEEEMTTAIRDEQRAAEDSEKTLINKANEQLAQANDTVQGLQTNLMRSNQQLKSAADKLFELETEVLPLARIKADDLFAKLEELDLVVGQLSGTKAARDLIQKICVDLEPLQARRSEVVPAKKPSPKLADVAQKVARTVGAAGDANVPSQQVPADVSQSPAEA